MHTAEKLEAKFWKALSADRIVMLGLDGAEEGHTRPMTAQVEHDKSPIWFFTSTDNNLVSKLRPNQRAIVTFSAKGHELFAALHGTLRRDDDRAAIDRLWNRFVAAWYPGGKDDPTLALLRLDATRADIWLNESNVFAGAKILFGADPRKDLKDSVAEVSLR